MKGKWNLLLILVFGVLVGWALGFLRLPYIEQNYSFLLGFLAGLAAISLALLLLAAWNRPFLPGQVGKKALSGESPKARTRTIIWIILAGVFALGGGMNGLKAYRQYQNFKLQAEDQHKQMAEMAALAAFARKSDMSPVLHSMLDDAGAELKRNSGRTLSDAMIARITDLSLASKPYQYINGDSLSKQALSPVRGQLLQALALMPIDTGTLTRIKQHGLFASADLQDAVLKGLDLSGINLKEANLKGADLSGSSLKGADLGATNLWGANLDQANLSNTNLNKSDLRWSKMNGANLTQANLNSADLSSAQLSKADLTGATFRWGQSAGTLFNEAILIHANLAGTNFTKANMSRATLRNADLESVIFSETDLGGAELDSATVSKDWAEKCKGWKPIGMNVLQQSYTVVNDTAGKWKRPVFRLKKN
jgi:uncharacterized protein YjbI with pentapeptide repeats